MITRTAFRKRVEEHEVYVLSSDNITQETIPRKEVTTVMYRVNEVPIRTIFQLAKLQVQSVSSFFYLKLRYGSPVTYLVLASVDGEVVHVQWVIPSFKIQKRYSFVEDSHYAIIKCATAPQFRGLGIYPAVLQFVTFSELPSECFWIWAEKQNIASLNGIQKAGGAKVGGFVQEKRLCGAYSKVESQISRNVNPARKLYSEVTHDSYRHVVKKDAIVNETHRPIVRKLEKNDLAAAAAIHKACFRYSVSVFSAVNSEILKRYYQMFVDEPNSCAAVLEDPVTRAVVGVTYGTRQPGIQKRFLRRYWFWLIGIIAKDLFTRATIWKAICGRLIRKNRLSMGVREFCPALEKLGVPAPTGPEDINLGIAILPDFRGSGNPARLLNFYQEQMFKAGVVRIRGAILTNNVASIIFFKRQGWQFRKASEREWVIWIDKPAEKVLKRISEDVCD